MKTKVISKLSNLLLMCLSFALIVSCSKDDDSSKEPADTVTLNMLNDQNGKTQLGLSNVYINQANNFYSSSSSIADVGKRAGVGSKVALKLDNLTNEAGVVPGHLYQIFNRREIRSFPSGAQAIPFNVPYYKAYVVSPLKSEEKLIGAVVKYVATYPDVKGLPEYGYSLGTVYNRGEQVELKLPKGAECDWDQQVANFFDVSTEGGKLTLTLTNYSQSSDQYPVYIRVGGAFTIVTVDISSYQ